MFRTIIIGARKSTLAKLQAYHVGMEMARSNPNIQIEYKFQESSGDKDLTSPLWKMEGRGVFTRDLQEELIQGRIHCIVHSWKDLDLEERPETDVISVLPRQDQRDVFLFKKSIWKQDTPPDNLIVCTSSPRREYNLSTLLPEILPTRYSESTINFTSIRGNIQTRLKKFLEGDYSGLIMAKAGIDRLLEFPDYIDSLPQDLHDQIPVQDREEFIEIRKTIAGYLNQCMIMVLPLSQNPNAPAQGALAVEILKKDREGLAIFRALTDPGTEENTIQERKTLGQFGGGCHQKIGVAVIQREWGQIQFLRGLTDSQQVLKENSILSPKDKITQQDSLTTNNDQTETDKLTRKSVPIPVSNFTQKDAPTPQPNFTVQENRSKKYDLSEIYPPNAKIISRKRNFLPAVIPKDKDLFVARKFALPKDISFLDPDQFSMSRILWTAGIGTWKDLAKRDIWVHGCSDSLGEKENPNLETILGRKTDFIKLTHSSSKEEHSTYPTIFTYELLDWKIPDDFDPEKIQVCFWRSGSEFDVLTKQYPILKNCIHFCGVGSTYDYLTSIGVSVIPSYSFSDWLESIIKNKEGIA